MDDFMVWLYFHYIMPTLEEASKGDFAEPINRLRSQLDVCQEFSCEDAFPNQRL